jgi:sulfide:quinone oxidoreductase
MDVLIAGGGVAALECLMALRDLAEDRVAVTIVAPEAEFELRALRTAESFGLEHGQARSLATVAERFGAELRTDTLAAVRPERHEAVLASAGVVSYDALVLATGARPVAAYEHGLTFGLEHGGADLAGIVADVEQRYTRSVAFVVPPGVTWPLPLYELALMTAARAWSMGVEDARIALVTPESAPLAMFGPVASAAVGDLLEQARVTFHGGVYAELEGHGRIALRPGGGELEAERIVALPLLAGQRILGVPADAAGFIPVDDHGRVRGVRDVYAAGDGADFPVKQGGLACQLADAVAARLALVAGADVAEQPFRPVLRGKLLTGAGAEYLRRPLHGGAGEGEASEIRLWSPPSKVSGRYLSQWLERPERSAPPDAPAEVDVDVALPSPDDLRREALSLDPYSPIPALVRWRGRAQARSGRSG